MTVHSSKSQDPIQGQIVGGGTAKLLFVIEQDKPLKFGLRTADDLQIFNKLHPSPKVRINHGTMVIGVRAEPGDKSSSRIWRDGAWGWATTVASLEKATKDQRTHPAGYYALKSNPKVGDGQAVTVKPCQWNERDSEGMLIARPLIFNV